MSAEIRTEAIVLQTIPFKEYDRILTLFSAQGVLKCFAKCKKKDYLHFAALTSPLTDAEFHYLPGRKDLHRLQEGTILKQNLRIRERYDSLQAAQSMIQALLQSQWPGKPTPHLFSLFRLFIEQLPNCAYPMSLATAFLLKILKHEGVLQISSPCAPSLRFAGEQYLATEAPPDAIYLTLEEESLLSEIALCRSLAHLSSQSLSNVFQQKICTLFSQTFN